MTKTQSIDFRRGILAVRDALLIHGRDGMNELFRVAEQELKAAGASHEPVDAHKVQCKCGWVGMTNELVLLDGKYECPACSTEFKSLTAWPPLKSGAPQDCNCPYHPGAGRQHLQDCPGLLRDPNDCRTP